MKLIEIWNKKINSEVRKEKTEFKYEYNFEITKIQNKKKGILKYLSI